MAEQQSLKNHTRVNVPYLALEVLNLTLVIASLVQLARNPNGLHWILLGLAVAVASGTGASRRWAVKNQDRLIRLEENVRLHWMGTDPSGLTMRQIIALRFAPDAEVVALAERADAEKLTPKQMKEAIVRWRPDYERV